MTVETSDPTPTANFAFTITVAIKSEDNTYFTRSCTITLRDSSSSTDLDGENSKDTSTGSASFSVYFKTSGSKTVTASCPETGVATPLENYVVVDVQQLKLIITTFSPVLDI